MLKRWLNILLLVLLSIATPSAQAGFISDVRDLTWEEGSLRLEISGLAGLRSGGKSRTGDININGTVEREFKLYEKLSVGLRAHPLFFYDEENSDGETIWGTGVGVTTRWYFQGDEKGWFGEIMESVIVHSEEFRGNSTNFNLLTEVGVGYKFENNWHVTGKWRHLSNGGIGTRNSGVNGVGVGIGFTF